MVVVVMVVVMMAVVGVWRKELIVFCFVVVGFRSVGSSRFEAARNSKKEQQGKGEKRAMNRRSRPSRLRSLTYAPAPERDVPKSMVDLAFRSVYTV